MLTSKLKRDAKSRLKEATTNGSALVLQFLDFFLSSIFSSSSSWSWPYHVFYTWGTLRCLCLSCLMHECSLGDMSALVLLQIYFPQDYSSILPSYEERTFCRVIKYRKFGNMCVLKNKDYWQRKEIRNGKIENISTFRHKSFRFWIICFWFDIEARARKQSVHFMHWIVLSIRLGSDII